MKRPHVARTRRAHQRACMSAARVCARMCPCAAVREHAHGHACVSARAHACRRVPSRECVFAYACVLVRGADMRACVRARVPVHARAPSGSREGSTYRRALKRRGALGRESEPQERLRFGAPRLVRLCVRTRRARHDLARVSDPSCRSACWWEAVRSIDAAACAVPACVLRWTPHGVRAVLAYLSTLTCRQASMNCCAASEAFAGVAGRIEPLRTCASPRVSVRARVCLRECVRTCLARVPACAGAGASAQARAWASEAQMRSF